jgi:hypothetical protein
MPAIATELQTSVYLYGITVAGGRAGVHPPGIGGSKVEETVQRRLAAVISRVVGRNVRPLRSNLAAHHQVLRELAARRPVLPIAFGTVADSDEQVEGILRDNYERLVQRLDWLQDKIEMALKVYWETANRFESLEEESRQRHTQRVMEALAPRSVEIRAIESHEERMIMKLACLVDKKNQQCWKDGVDKVAEEFGNHYCFHQSGPWAPCNFAEIEVQT